MPNQLATARYKASEHNIGTFSDMTNRVTSTTKKKQDYLKNLTQKPNNFSTTVVADQRIRYVVIDTEKKLGIIHSPQPWTDNSTSHYVGVLGDDIVGSTRVLIDHNAFDKVAIVLMKESDAKIAGFPIMEPVPTGCLDKATEGNTAPTKLTHQRLGFTTGAFPHAPIFTVVPTAYPLEPGEYFGLDGHKISDPLPPVGPQAHDPTFLIWLNTMEHMERVNKGLPCQAPGGVLFSAADWQPKVTTASDKDDDNDDDDDHASTILDKIGFRIANIFTTPATILAPNSTATTETKETVDESILTKFNPFLSSLPPPPEPSVSPPSDSLHLVEALAKAINKNSESNDRNSTDNSAATVSNLMRIQLLFASTRLNEDGVNCIRPAALQENFRGIAGTKNVTRRQNLMQTEVNRSQMASVGLNDKVMSRVDLHPKVCSQVMISQLLEHNFFDAQLESQRDNIDKRITIFNFARIDKNDANWKQLITSSAQIEDDELFETDKKKHVAKSRHLYIYGCTATLEDLIVCLANFMFFCHFLVVDAQHSVLYKCINSVYDIFTTHEGREWINNQIPTRPHIVHSILVDVHRIIRQFLVSVSMNHSVLQLALNKDDIPTSNTIDKANKYAEAIIGSLNNGPAIGINIAYEKPHDTYGWFRSTITIPTNNNTNQPGSATRPNLAPGPGRGNGGRGAGGRGGRGNGGRGNGGRGNGPIELDEAVVKKRQSEGFLLCKTRKTPRFNHIFKNGNGKSACNGHMFRERFCQKTASACHKYHVPAYKDLPKVDKDAIQTWVNDTNEVYFAPDIGATPSE